MDHEIKNNLCLNTRTKMEKKSGKKLSGLQNGAIRGLKIGASFRDYKSGQRGLQIGASLGISDRGKKIIKDFK